MKTIFLITKKKDFARLGISVIFPHETSYLPSEFRQASLLSTTNLPSNTEITKDDSAHKENKKEYQKTTKEKQ
jgi:hypothetical protein